LVCRDDRNSITATSPSRQRWAQFCRMTKTLPLLYLFFLIGCIDNSTVPVEANEQNSCEEKKQPDSIALINFSKHLNSVATSRNLEELSKLFHFPFPYTSCDLDSNADEHPTRLISKEEFIKTGITDLFGAWFTETVSKGYIYYILYSYHSKGRCQLVFDYPLALTGGSGKCRRLYVAIEKFEGTYKLSSAWQSE
jgi:hypothetical protein